MISEFIINIVFGILSGFLELLPDIQLDLIGSPLYGAFLDFVEMACYLFPMNTFFTIFGIVVALTIFRIIVSLVKTIWELLPLV